MGFIDPAADRGDDLVDDAQQVLLVLEAHAERLEHAAAFHVDAFMTVDQDIAYARVLQQRLQRTEPGHLVENFSDEVGKLMRVQRKTFGQHVLADHVLHVTADFVLGQFFKRGEVDLLDELAVQPHLGVKQLVASQGIVARGRRRLGRGLA